MNFFIVVWVIGLVSFPNNFLYYIWKRLESFVQKVYGIFLWLSSYLSFAAFLFVIGIFTTLLASSRQLLWWMALFDYLLFYLFHVVLMLCSLFFFLSAWALSRVFLTVSRDGALLCWLFGSLFSTGCLAFSYVCYWIFGQCLAAFFKFISHSARASYFLCFTFVEDRATLDKLIMCDWLG